MAADRSDSRRKGHASTDATPATGAGAGTRPRAGSPAIEETEAVVRGGVTIRQLAGMLGLSYPTVANILSGDPDRRNRHAPETQTRVLDTAAELGYLPNRAARAVKTGRFSSVALVLASDSDQSYLPRKLLDGIFGGLADYRLELSVAKLYEASLTDPELVPRPLRERACDGLLVNITHDASDALEKLVAQSGLPHIWINNKRASDAVHPDDMGAGVAATERLLSAGHRRITYVQLIHEEIDVGTPGIHYSVGDRYRGYEQAMRRAGLTPDPIQKSNAQSGMSAVVRKLLERKQRPTAIVAYSDAETLAAYVAVLSLGLRIEKDVSIVSLADNPITIGDHDIVTVSADRERMGREAVELLHRRIAGSGPLPVMAIPPLVSGGSSVGRA